MKNFIKFIKEDVIYFLIQLKIINKYLAYTIKNDEVQVNFNLKELIEFTIH